LDKDELKVCFLQDRNISIYVSFFPSAVSNHLQECLEKNKITKRKTSTGSVAVKIDRKIIT